MGVSPVWSAFSTAIPVIPPLLRFGYVFFEGRIRFPTSRSVCNGYNRKGTTSVGVVNSLVIWLEVNRMNMPLVNCRNKRQGVIRTLVAHVTCSNGAIWMKEWQPSCLLCHQGDNCPRELSTKQL